MFQLFRNSVNLGEQRIGIGALSEKEYFHTGTGQIVEGQGHYDLNTEHFYQCSISESLEWLGFLLFIQKINGKRKSNIDIMSEKVKGQSSYNYLVALYFWQNIFTSLNHRCIQLGKHMTDNDWKTPITSKVKKVIGQGQ